MRTLGLVLLVGCGGGASTSDAPSHDTPIMGAESNCFDGIDNNGDGLIDCADPTCAAIASCIPAIPTGWTGSFALYDGLPTTRPTSCVPPFTTPMPAGDHELTAPTATCAACACSAPTGGACAASGGAATVPSIAWADSGLACMAPTTALGCTGASCQARPPSPFVATSCIAQAGVQPCPTGFADRHVFYTAVDDTRGCAPCTCGIASGGVCAVGGGTPTGSAVPRDASATTYCCVH